MIFPTQGLQSKKFRCFVCGVLWSISGFWRHCMHQAIHLRTDSPKCCFRHHPPPFSNYLFGVIFGPLCFPAVLEKASFSAIQRSFVPRTDSHPSQGRCGRGDIQRACGRRPGVQTAASRPAAQQQWAPGKTPHSLVFHFRNNWIGMFYSLSKPFGHLYPYPGNNSSCCPYGIDRV